MSVLFAVSLAISAVLVYRFFVRHATHGTTPTYRMQWRHLVTPTRHGAQEALDNQPAHVIADIAARTFPTGPDKRDGGSPPPGSVRGVDL